MTLSDAKKILSGRYCIDADGATAWLLPNAGKDKYVVVALNKQDMQFALRQLALKVEREHKKMNEREK